jgi:hypothetical protein
MNACKPLAVAVALCSATVAHAALYDRGNGMIYDSTQDITWLQDANYAKTTGYDPAGGMTWDQATAWAAQLNFGGYADWRLSSARLNGNNGFSYDGSTDRGYNNTRSEIGHLFVELGNVHDCNTSGVCGQPNPGFRHTSFIDPDTNQSVSFLNVQLASYWQAEDWKMDPVYAWRFNNSVGAQNSEFVFNDYYAWAVRDGDVANVPVPAAAWLFGSALAGLLATRRRTT